MRARLSVFCCFKFVLTAALLSFVALSPASAQSTAFTYQGSLDDAGAPASGLHDFRFKLWNAASGGLIVAPPVCVDDVSVVEGLFTTQIDFGAFATTAPRFIEVDVRRDTGLTCSDATGFVVMAPRHQITAAPLATHANSAFSLDAADGSPTSAVFVDNSGNVGIGTTTPTARLDVRGGAMLVENVGDQAELLWLASERSWVFKQEGTGAGTALKLENIGGGGNKNFIVQTTGFMGVGTTAPAAKLDVRGDIRLGPSGQFQATAGDENLRLLRGDIDGNGTVLSGSGFSVIRFTEGVYDITFSPAFSGVPTVIPFADRPVSGQMRFTDVAAPTSSWVRIIVWNESDDLTDSDFSICVIGPR
jgi:hypothetical protein